MFKMVTLSAFLSGVETQLAMSVNLHSAFFLVLNSGDAKVQRKAMNDAVKVYRKEWVDNVQDLDSIMDPCVEELTDPSFVRPRPR